MRVSAALLLIFAAMTMAQTAEVIPVTGDELLQLIEDAEESVVVLNIWATWCKPCVDEFPELIEFARENADKDVRLILVSADFDDQMEKLNQFLAKHEVEFTTYLKTGKDQDFIGAFKDVSWHGALPFTVVYDKNRTPVARFGSRITKSDLDEHVSNVLN